MSNPVNAYLKDKYEWGLLCECPINATIIEPGKARLLYPCGHMYGLPTILEYFGEVIGKVFASQSTRKQDICGICRTKVVTYIPSPGAEELMDRGKQYVIRNDRIVEEIESLKQKLPEPVLESVLKAHRAAMGIVPPQKFVVTAPCGHIKILQEGEAVAPAKENEICSDCKSPVAAILKSSSLEQLFAGQHALYHHGVALRAELERFREASQKMMSGTMKKVPEPVHEEIAFDLRDYPSANKLGGRFTCNRPPTPHDANELLTYPLISHRMSFRNSREGAFICYFRLYAFKDHVELYISSNHKDFPAYVESFGFHLDANEERDTLNNKGARAKMQVFTARTPLEMKWALRILELNEFANEFDEECFALMRQMIEANDWFTVEAKNQKLVSKGFEKYREIRKRDLEFEALKQGRHQQAFADEEMKKPPASSSRDSEMKRPPLPRSSTSERPKSTSSGGQRVAQQELSGPELEQLVKEQLRALGGFLGSLLNSKKQE
ncbi:MAG TPA: hypothetical protein VGO47_11280 [Chlamydiales bacterium]|jgi:hypothetical protein|nr:hypothetical protein [Chlamydiales bacterium]